MLNICFEDEKWSSRNITKGWLIGESSYEMFHWNEQSNKLIYEKDSVWTTVFVQERKSFYTVTILFQVLSMNLTN